MNDGGPPHSPASRTKAQSLISHRLPFGSVLEGPKDRRDNRNRQKSDDQFRWSLPRERCKRRRADAVGEPGSRWPTRRTEAIAINDFICSGERHL